MSRQLAPGVSERVGALLLAAGLSRRMGENKLLLPLGGAPVVAHSADAVLASGAEPVVVVTGRDAEAVRTALAGRALVFAHNPAAEAGLAGSLRVGLAALPADVDGALVCLADMPWQRAADLAALIAAFRASGGRAICAPVFAGRRGNPVLWPARYFAALAALHGDRGARELLTAHASEVCYVPVSDAGVTRDVDTPEDLGRPA